jgi:hypothetical protein
MRTSKRKSGGSESGKRCKTRPYARAEWTSELQGETHWALALAGAATVSWAKGIVIQLYLMSGAGLFTPVASPAGVLLKSLPEALICC